MEVNMVNPLVLSIVLFGTGAAAEPSQTLKYLRAVSIASVDRPPLHIFNAAADKTDLSKVSGLWAKLWMEKKLEEVLELYADDAVFLTGSGDRFTGKVAIRNLFKMALETNTSNISVRSIRTKVSDDMAFDSGDYRETLTPLSGAAKMELQGNYLIVFKNVGGKWLILEHVWTDKLVKNAKQEGRPSS